METRAAPNSSTNRNVAMCRSVALANQRAISTLGHVLTGHVLTGGGEAAAEALAWTTWLQFRQQGGHSLTVLEHTVMAYILRSGFLDRFSGSRRRRDIESVLRTSWLHLAGKSVEAQNLAGRLPRSVLRKASREERLFHAAAFQPPGPKAARSQNSLGHDYVPELRDLVAATGFAAFAFTGMASSVLGGAAIGYAIASVAEYGMHRWAGHEAGGPLKPVLEKSGWIGRKISDHLATIHLGHFVVHHVETSNKNYTTQFALSSPGDRSTIDAKLDALGEVGTRIKKTDYGMTLTPAGVTAGLLVTLPICMTLICLLGLEPLSAVALMVPSLLYVAASKYLHPCLHKSREEAMATSGPFMRFLLGTRYVEWISRAHWIHHKGGGGNYNLLPGADALFGDLRKPNLSMVLRMRADGILGAAQGGGPRFIGLTPSARPRYAANELGDTIVTCRADPASGKLTPTGPPASSISCGSMQTQSRERSACIEPRERPAHDGVMDQPFTPSNSTSNISVALGGMTPPAPRAP